MKNYHPDFVRWLTFAQTEAMTGQYDASCDKRRQFRTLREDVFAEFVVRGESCPRVTKSDDSGVKHTFRYLGAINLHQEEVFTEVLFVDDGRVWRHAAMDDKGFAPLEEVVQLFQSSIV